MSVLSLAFCTLGNSACDDTPHDPFTGQQLRVAQHLDLGRQYGSVSAKRVGNYVERHNGSDAKVGDAYFCLSLYSLPDDRGYHTTTEYCGVQRETYDAVELGTQLPMERIYSVHDIAKLDGRSVDRWANPPAGQWYVVVDRLTAIGVYQVDSVTYYRHIDLGMRLPFEPQ